MRALFLLLVASIMSPAVAGTVAVPNTFQPNTPALASEVNANFDALVQAVNALQAQVDAQAATISTLESDLASAETALSAAESQIGALQSNSVLALDGLLFLDLDAEGNDVARFDQVNVQITNGLGATNGDPMLNPNNPGPVNGLGNLVIGYNEATGFGSLACSDGQFADQTACEDAGETWAREQRTGSHNLVLGAGQFYTSHGGLLAGNRNIVNRAWASVSGGRLNTASGNSSSVSGGEFNFASGTWSSVSGGFGNTASGSWSSVSGGSSNTASGSVGSVSGGFAGEETATAGWCAGGESGTTICD